MKVFFITYMDPLTINLFIDGFSMALAATTFLAIIFALIPWPEDPVTPHVEPPELIINDLSYEDTDG